MREAMKAGALLLGMGLLAAVPAAGMERPHEGPSVSPDGRYVVTQTARPARDGGWDYRLVLLDRRDGKRRLLYRHARHVELAWAPDSRRLILNDHYASDRAACHVVRLPAVAFQSPDARLLRAAGVRARLGGEPYHLYSECTGWTGPRRLTARVRGDGPAGAVEARLDYALDGRTRLLALDQRPWEAVAEGR